MRLCVCSLPALLCTVCDSAICLFNHLPESSRTLTGCKHTRPNPTVNQPITLHKEQNHLRDNTQLLCVLYVKLKFNKLNIKVNLFSSFPSLGGALCDSQLKMFAFLHRLSANTRILLTTLPVTLRSSQEVNRLFQQHIIPHAL